MKLKYIYNKKRGTWKVMVSNYMNLRLAKYLKAKHHDEFYPGVPIHLQACFKTADSFYNLNTILLIQRFVP